MKEPVRLVIIACLTGLLAALNGCTALRGPLGTRWLADAGLSDETPTRIVAIWTVAVAHSPGGPPMRGFGGRLMFYGNQLDEPLRVQGTLIVYAYEESNPADAQQTAADRKYVFTPEQLAQCYSKSSLGHSYSVWIPWDKVGGPAQEVSLLVTLVPEKGPPVASRLAHLVLEGKSRQSPQAQRPGPPPVMPSVETFSRRRPPAQRQPSENAVAAPVGPESPPGGVLAANGPSVPSHAATGGTSRRRMHTTTLPYQPRLPAQSRQ